MKLARRRFLRLAMRAAVVPALPRFANAQAYPSRPITLIVPFAAGGMTDVLGRIIGERMRKSLGQPVIIENVSGADGSIGAGRAAHARPDGYTIDIGDNNDHVLNGAFYSLQYDVMRDFAPIAPLVTTPFVIFAKKSLPVDDLKGLIAWLKSNPDKASTGIFIVSLRVMVALFEKETRTHLVVVPYRGGAPAMQDLLAGQIDFLFGTPDQLPLARSGSIKALAVTSDTRLTLAPVIPTVGEMGLPAFSSFGSWFGLFAPAGTPADIIAKLNAAAVDSLADGAVRARIAELGQNIFPRERQTPEALAALVKADAEKWWPTVKALGIKNE
jgi:tripartite-type tricarboxylate transporter receptor subunit TctC